LRTENASIDMKEIVGVVRLRTPSEVDDLLEENPRGTNHPKSRPTFGSKPF
jgi:hypothetical protein